MKRINNIYAQICSIDNLMLADHRARMNKAHQYGVQRHDENQEANILSLHAMLINKTYKTSAYNTRTIHEPKERLIYILPYFPDRILHHAIMNIIEPVFTAMFTADTYSCIKGKGIHGCADAIKKALRDGPGTEYCLQIDIKKFYPSIDHRILKGLLGRKFKDQDFIELVYGIIDSAPGLPIGNYLSQFFANFYLAYFDHWIKEEMGVKYYFRYADDIAIMGATKEELHQLLAAIKKYFYENLKLEVKKNYRIFPMSCGLDMVGYVFHHQYTRMRPSIKRSFARMIAKRPNTASISAYMGWAIHADTKHLLKKLLLYDSNNSTIQSAKRHYEKKLYRRQNSDRRSTGKRAYG